MPHQKDEFVTNWEEESYSRIQFYGWYYFTAVTLFRLNVFGIHTLYYALVKYLLLYREIGVRLRSVHS